MTDRTAALEDNLGFRRLRCPHCGNDGKSAFNAETFVLIGGDGVPFIVASYAEAPDPQIDCHACDYKGPIDRFTQRHRPGARLRHPR